MQLFTCPVCLEDHHLRKKNKEDRHPRICNHKHHNRLCSGSGLEVRRGQVVRDESVPLHQYPNGTDVLWMAHYRKDPFGGDMDGTAIKLSGTLEEAAKEAQKFAEKENLILQCLRRRY